MVDGTRPSRTSEMENTASVAAIAMSQQQMRPTPPAKAAPLTRATTGCGSCVERAQHGGKAHRVGNVLGLALAGHPPHPVEVAAGRERRTRAGQHEHANGSVRADAAEGIGEIADDRLVERIAPLRPVERERGDAARVGRKGEIARAHAHIRKMPNSVLAIGALRLAESASARTRRVWAGSITPSSQRRALA